MANAHYAAAARDLGWLLWAGEALMASTTGEILSIADIRTSSATRVASDEQLRIALRAWNDLGIVSGEAATIRINRERLHRTAGFRGGVRAAVDTSAPLAPVAQLCATVPATLPHAVTASFASTFVELRSAIWNLIASATRDVIIASPFWDDVTVGELTPLLANRAEKRVEIRILGRSEARECRLELSRVPRVQTFAFSHANPSDPFGVSTFHFKAIAVDHAAALVSSANLAEASLRSRVELGVILHGSSAAMGCTTTWPRFYLCPTH